MQVRKLASATQDAFRGHTFIDNIRSHKLISGRGLPIEPGSQMGGYIGSQKEGEEWRDLRETCCKMIDTSRMIHVARCKVHKDA